MRLPGSPPKGLPLSNAYVGGAVADGGADADARRALVRWAGGVGGARAVRSPKGPPTQPPNAMRATTVYVSTPELAALSNTAMWLTPSCATRAAEVPSKWGQIAYLSNRTDKLP